jgi:SAM-dependent methyltransferase
MKGVPDDYYRRLAEVEQRHWWMRGMRETAAALLGPRLRGALLDAGCGTGGFLRFAADRRCCERLAGTDLSPEAVEAARRRVPEAELHVAPLHRLPFEDGSFDVAVLNDVLQHVHEDEVEPGLRELRRVLRGPLLVRTNGACHGDSHRPDWRLYDARSLARDLERGGFRVERVTHANAIMSLAGRKPRPPTRGTCGIPRVPGRVASAVGSSALSLERRWLAAGGSLPYGHTLFALAT